MIYLGVDPGKKGGIAVICRPVVEVYPYSDKKLIEVCRQSGEYRIATVESVHAMPGQGVTSTFSFG